MAEIILAVILLLLKLALNAFAALAWWALSRLFGLLARAFA